MTDTDNSTGSGNASITDTTGFIYEPVRGSKRKIEFEPRSDNRFERVESVWTGCRWRITGREIVTKIRRI